ncbi:hypothetical protein HanPSC8_Chr10g0407351 [Helianthus annuus]|nr:hypothetical protein HanPSC8_Chr10g0407351 [Helianthus annuus]
MILLQLNSANIHSSAHLKRMHQCNVRSLNNYHHIIIRLKLIISFSTYIILDQ